MNLKKYFFLAGLFAIASTGATEARISLFSPWTFQERLPTEEGQLDQSSGLQAGIEGITPPGADMETKFVSFPYFLTYGLKGKAEIGAGWGLLWLERSGRNSQFGVTDFMVGGRYRFFDANRADRTPGLDIEAAFSFPTGSYEKGLGTGGLGILFGWGLVLPLDPVRTHIGMSYRYNTENSDHIRVGGIFSYGGGLSYPIPQVKDLSITGEIKGMNHSRNKRSGNDISSAADELYLVPGAIYTFKPGYRLLGGLLLGLTGDSSDVGFNIELQF